MTARPLQLNNAMVSARLACLSGLLCLLTGAGSLADTVDIREWLVPWEKSEPSSPFVDTRGTVWFLSYRENFIANFSPASGQFNKYDMLHNVGPQTLIVDAARNIWFTARKGGQLARMNPATGQVETIEIPGRRSQDPYSLTNDAAGNVWFTLQGDSRVGIMRHTSADIETVELPGGRMRPAHMTIAPNGEAWTHSSNRSVLFGINPEDLVPRAVDLPNDKSRVSAITTTSDGAIWYADAALGLLGRYDPRVKSFAEWQLPGGDDSEPSAIASDRDDRIWIVESGQSPSRFVGFDTTRGSFLTVTEIPTGAGVVSSLHYNEAGGEIWFTTETNYIGRAKIH